MFIEFIGLVDITDVATIIQNNQLACLMVSNVSFQCFQKQVVLIAHDIQGRFLKRLPFKLP